MSDNGQQVPLIERPPRPDADEVDTRGKSEAANDRIAALEHKVETMRDELNIARASIAGLERELAAERERREAAEAELAAERKRRASAEWALKEIRVRLHAAGRRPEECWEMSEIDGHLAQFGRHKD